MPQEYVPMMLAFVIIIGLLGAPLLLIARWFGPFHPSKIKQMPFECGNPSEGSGHRRFSVHYYVVALLFVLFDLEVVFLYPLGVQYKSLGLFGLVEMTVFLGVLTLGLVYAWRKGALEWE